MRLSKPLAHWVTEQPIERHLLTLCPSQDLIAYVAKDGQIVVDRLEGQLARTYGSRGDDNQFVSLAWSEDHTALCALTKKGRVLVIDVGNATSRDEWLGSATDDSGSTPLAIFLSVNNVTDSPKEDQDDDEDDQQQTQDTEHPISDWERAIKTLKVKNTLEPAPQTNDIGQAQSIAKQLSTISILEELPRLNALRHVDASYIFGARDVSYFENQSYIDAEVNSSMQPGRGQAGIVSSLFPLQNGNLEIVAGQHVLGSCELVKLGHSSDHYSVVHASNRSSQCHAFLINKSTHVMPTPGQTTTLGKKELSLSIVSLRGRRQSGYQFQQVIGYLKRLNNLLTYVLLCALELRDVWASWRVVPSRYMEGISETLKEKGEYSIEAAFYHLAATGDCIPDVKEWLVDILQERGHKRWEDTSMKAYHYIGLVLHEYLIPALERLTVAASRLRVYSRTPNLPCFNVDEKILTRMIDDIDILRLLANHILVHAKSEAHQFRIFSAWLKCQIELFRAEPGSASEREAEEKISNVDFAQLFAYITGALNNSHLNIFLGRATPTVVDSSRSRNRSSSRQVILSMLEKHRKSPMQPNSHVVELVNLLYQTLVLRDAYLEMAKRIPEGFQETIDVAQDVVVDPEEHSDLQDVYMTSSTPHSSRAETYAASVPAKSLSSVRLYQITHDAELPSPEQGRPEKGIRSSKLTTLGLGHQEPGEIKAIKFVDGLHLMVLFATKTQTTLLNLPYAMEAASVSTRPPSLFAWSDVPNSSDADHNYIPVNNLARYTVAAFPHDMKGTKTQGAAVAKANAVPFVPVHFEVNGRLGRRSVVLLDQSRMALASYRIEE